MTFPEDFIDKVIESHCITVMREMPDNCVDAIVTDPPYGLEFMGKEWDKLGASIEPTAKSAGGYGKDSLTNENAYAAARVRYGVSPKSMQDWHYEWALEAFRVLKSGGYLLAFGGSRTYHRLVCAIEDAGFEIRDQIQWIYGSGFPKSLDVSKAIDKTMGREREIIGTQRLSGNACVPTKQKGGTYGVGVGTAPAQNVPITVGASDEAKHWEGFGTALKPAHEPICVARKPLSEGTVAANVLKWGTGALDIDGCRVDGMQGSGVWGSSNENCQIGRIFNQSPDGEDYKSEPHPKGRWPANVIHDGSEEVTQLLPQSDGSKLIQRRKGFRRFSGREYNGGREYFTDAYESPGYSDNGSAARFFYCAKASRSERGEDNNHCTVKPIALMEYLIRLVSRPGYLILDPFIGSGTTGLACMNTGRRFIGIERESAYCDIARRRIATVQEQSVLVGV